MCHSGELLPETLVEVFRQIAFDVEHEAKLESPTRLWLGEIVFRADVLQFTLLEQAPPKSPCVIVLDDVLGRTLQRNGVQDAPKWMLRF